MKISIATTKNITHYKIPTNNDQSNKYIKTLNLDLVKFSSSKIKPLPHPKDDFEMLAPTTNLSWANLGTCNPGVIRLPDGTILLAFTGLSTHSPDTVGKLSSAFTNNKNQPQRIASIGIAKFSPDGKKLTRITQEPIISVFNDFNLFKQFPNGFEDPRINKIGDDYYLHLNGINKSLEDQTSDAAGKDLSKPIQGQTMYLVKTKDWTNFDHVGVIGPKVFNKNAFFHPQTYLVNGNPVSILFHRLMPSIQATTFQNIQELKTDKFWETALTNRKRDAILNPKFYWEGMHPPLVAGRSGQVAGGGPPLPVEIDIQNKTLATQSTPLDQRKTLWLMFYNGAYADSHPLSTWPPDRAIGAALLEIKDNSQDAQRPIKIDVISRSPSPLIKPGFTHPRARWKGQADFTTGAIESEDKKSYMVIYSRNAFDTRCSVFDKNEIIEYLLQFNKDGEYKEQKGLS